MGKEINLCHFQLYVLNLQRAACYVEEAVILSWFLSCLYKELDMVKAGKYVPWRLASDVMRIIT
jgi:hypothetical protein